MFKASTAKPAPSRAESSVASDLDRLSLKVGNTAPGADAMGDHVLQEAHNQQLAEYLRSAKKTVNGLPGLAMPCWKCLVTHSVAAQGSTSSSTTPGFNAAKSCKTRKLKEETCSAMLAAWHWLSPGRAPR